MHILRFIFDFGVIEALLPPLTIMTEIKPLRPRSFMGRFLQPRRAPTTTVKELFVHFVGEVKELYKCGDVETVRQRTASYMADTLPILRSQAGGRRLWYADGTLVLAGQTLVGTVAEEDAIDRQDQILDPSHIDVDNDAAGDDIH